MFERFHRACAIGSMVGIGDGEFPEPPVAECRLQIAQCGVNLERGFVGREEDNAAGGILLAPIQGEGLVRQIENKLLVRGEIDLKWRTVLDLAKEIARRAKGQLDVPPGLFR